MKNTIPRLALLDRWLQQALEQEPDERRHWLRANCPDAEVRVLAEQSLDHIEEDEGGHATSRPVDALEPGSAFAGPLWIDLEQELSSVETMARERLGAYEVISTEGDDELGKVLIARHLESGRRVVIKALSPPLGLDDDQLTNLQQEVETLAQLDHPNLARVYEMLIAEDNAFLVSELVSGETLALRLERRGAFGHAEATILARQLVAALEAGHHQGFRHQRLSPQALVVSATGELKLLDLGLATLRESSEVDGSTAAAGAPTTAYTSPERASGKADDSRADIWAFGCILYELLTGVSPFERETASGTLAAILRDEPDWSQLPNGTPASLAALLARCLRKDPSRRLRDISLASMVLGGVTVPDSPSSEDSARTTSPANSHSGTATAAPSPSARHPRAASARDESEGRGGWIAAVLASLVAALMGFFVWMNPAKEASASRPSTEMPASSSLRILEVNMPPGVELPRDYPAPLDISPDGRRIVFVGQVDENTRALFLRRLGHLEAERLPDTEGALSPAFSPDGQSVAFLAGRTLRKLRIGERRAIDIASPGSALRGLDWLEDGGIVFTPSQNSGLTTVNALGRDERALTTLDASRDERSHRWPQTLADGRHVLYTVDYEGAAFDEASLFVVDIDTGATQHVLSNASHGRMAANGHLIYANGGRLLGATVDPETFALRGQPTEALGGVAYDIRNGGTHLSLSDTGTLVWVPQPPRTSNREPVWLSPDGTRETLVHEERRYRMLALSHSGERLAIGLGGALDADLWAIDLEGGINTQLTSDLNIASVTWDHDDRRLIASSRQSGGAVSGENRWQIHAVSTVEAFDTEALYASDRPMFVNSVLSDGRIVFEHLHPTNGWDLMALDPETRAVEALVATPSNEVRLAVSPDGRWVAFESDAFEGFYEIYVQPTAGGDRLRVSNGGARAPTFQRDGRLFYFATEGENSAIWRVDFDAAAEDFRVLRNERVVGTHVRGEFFLITPNWGGFEVDRSEDRFLLLRQRYTDDPGPRRLMVAEGWRADGQGR